MDSKRRHPQPLPFFPPPMQPMPTFGVGILLSKHESEYRIAWLVPGHAADTSGKVTVGDVVLSIDGTLLEGLSMNQINGMIEGPEGTTLMLCLTDASKGGRRYVNLTRQKDARRVDGVAAPEINTQSDFGDEKSGGGGHASSSDSSSTPSSPIAATSADEKQKATPPPSRIVPMLNLSAVTQMNASLQSTQKDERVVGKETSSPRERDVRSPRNPVCVIGADIEGEKVTNDSSTWKGLVNHNQTAQQKAGAGGDMLAGAANHSHGTESFLSPRIAIPAHPYLSQNDKSDASPSAEVRRQIRQQRREWVEATSKAVNEAAQMQQQPLEAFEKDALARTSASALSTDSSTGPPLNQSAASQSHHGSDESSARNPSSSDSSRLHPDDLAPRGATREWVSTPRLRADASGTLRSEPTSTPRGEAATSTDSASRKSMMTQSMTPRTGSVSAGVASGDLTPRTRGGQQKMGLLLHQSHAVAPVVVEEITEGPVKVTGCVSVGDHITSIDGRDVRGRSLAQVYREILAPCAAACDPDQILIGFSRARGGHVVNFWVALPRPGGRSVGVTSEPLPSPRHNPTPEALAHESLQALRASFSSPRMYTPSQYVSSTAATAAIATPRTYTVSGDATADDQEDEAKMMELRDAAIRTSLGGQMKVRGMGDVVGTGDWQRKDVSAFADAKWREEGGKALTRAMECVLLGDAEEARNCFGKAVFYYKQCRAKDMNEPLGKADRRIKELELQRSRGGYARDQRTDSNLLYSHAMSSPRLWSNTTESTSYIILSPRWKDELPTSDLSQRGSVSGVPMDLYSMPSRQSYSELSSSSDSGGRRYVISSIV